MKEFTSRHFFGPNGEIHLIPQHGYFQLHGDFVLSNPQLFGFESLKQIQYDPLQKVARRGYIRGTHEFDGGSHIHALSYEDHKGATPAKFTKALEVLHAHYSKHPKRKFSISVHAFDNIDENEKLAEKMFKITGDDNDISLKTLKHIEDFIGQKKSTEAPTPPPFRQSEIIPTVNTSRLGKEVNIGRGNMTTAEWNFWRRKGLGDSYNPLMTFKQFITEEGIEPIKPVVPIQPEFPQMLKHENIKITNNPTLDTAMYDIKNRTLHLPTRTGDQYTASLFRLDDKSLTSETKEFDFDAQSNSGPKGAFGNQKGITTRRGMFAAQLHEVAPYAVGRETPFIFRIPQGSTRGTVYLQNKHREQIAARRPTLSAFDSRGFERLPSNEHFMETHKTPTPHSQRVIDDPIKFLSQFHDIEWVDDLTPYVKKFNSDKSSDISTTVNRAY